MRYHALSGIVISGVSVVHRSWLLEVLISKF